MTNTQGLGQGSLTLLILGSMAFDSVFDSGVRHAPLLANYHPHSPNLIGHQVSTGPPHKNLHQDPCGGWSKLFCPWCSPELTWHDLFWGLLSSCPLCPVVQLLFPQSLRTGRGELCPLLLSGQDCSKVQMPWSASRFRLLIRFFLMAKSYSECQMLTITSLPQHFCCINYFKSLLNIIMLSLFTNSEYPNPSILFPRGCFEFFDFIRRL